MDVGGDSRRYGCKTCVHRYSHGSWVREQAIKPRPQIVINPMELYAISIYTRQKQNDGSWTMFHSAAVCWAMSKAEAVGKGLEKARELYPLSEGYRYHDADVLLIPKEYRTS